MAQRRHPPNRPLAWERLQRGWSYEETADQIRAAMVSDREVDTGLTANTVRRWETGERWPDPRYRKHLVKIFNKPASELGLLTPEELSLRPQNDVFAEDRRLRDMLEEFSGSAGWDRAAVIRALAGAGVLPLVTPLLSLHEPQAVAAPEPDLMAYQQIVSAQRSLYWTSPARPLFEAAYAHTQLGIGLLRGATVGARTTLAAALAQSALLAARLSFFDLRQAAVAQRCLDVALAASREAGDHALAAVVLGHMAFIPGFGHDPDAAHSLLTSALQHAWHGVSPTVRSWLHCVASEVDARTGHGSASRHEIDLATAAVHDADTGPDWLDFYDASRLDAFAGYTALSAGDQDEAANRLTRAAEGLACTAGKQRSVILADLASAHRADVEHAADYLHQALDTLETDWYGTGLARVSAVRAGMGDSSHTRQVDDRIAELAAAGRNALPSRWAKRAAQPLGSHGLVVSPH